MTIKRIQSIAISLCGIFAVAMVAMAVVNFKTFVQQQRVWEEKKADLDSLKAEIISIKKSLDLYEREKQEFQKYLFAEKDVPAFLDGISKIAQETLAMVKEMRTGKFEEVIIPNAEKKNSATKSNQGKKQDEAAEFKEQMQQALTLAAMPIRFRVEATYPAFVDFLGQLEGFDQLVTITDVEMISDQDYPTLKCGFTLKIYSLKTLEELQRK